LRVPTRSPEAVPARVPRFVLIAPLLLLLAACTRGGAVAAIPEPAPHDGGTLTYALSADPVSVTPLYGGDAAGIVVERNVFAGLVDADPSTLRTVPSIARSWSSSADGRRFTFHLRAGVSFGSGAGPVTADTFVQDWALLCSRPVASPNAAVLSSVAGYGACRRGAGTLAGARAAGPLTLVVSLSRAVRDFPSTLVDPATWAFPPQLADTAAARAAFEQAPVGAGPFQVESIVHSRQPAGKAPVPGEVVLTANAAYFGSRPHVDRVVMPVVTQADAARSIAAYRSGSYQVLDVPAAAVDVVRADPGFDRQLVDLPRLSLIYLRATGGSSPVPALGGAIDPAALVSQALGKSGQPADGLLPVGMPGYIPGVAHFPATSLGSATVTLTHVTDPTLASLTAALAQALRAKGAQVSVVRHGAWTVSELDLQSATADALLAGLAGQDSPLVAGVEAASGTARDTALLDAQRTLLAGGQLVPLAFGQTELLEAPPVHDLGIDALGAPRLDSVWLATG
jgi:peptide/nickel transport system substrate-binding protein